MMKNTKEQILFTALRLFSQDGYKAVSVSAISGELGMTKSVLYKHYKSKREIFDNIVLRMQESDEEKAKENDVPQGNLGEMPQKYQNTEIDNIKIYSMEMFKYWTEEEFSSCFRKMLTLEQYRDKEMSQLYKQYLSSGPLDYISDIFHEIIGNKEEAKNLAMEFYSPMFLYYNIYDNAEDKQSVIKTINNYIENFCDKLKRR